MARENQIVESDKPHSRKLYRQKGWKGFVHSYKNYVENGSYDDVVWDKKSKAKSVDVGDFVTVYKF